MPGFFQQLDLNAYLSNWLGRRVEHLGLRLFEECNREFARDGREIVQNFIQRLAALEIVEDGLDRNARPGKTRRATHNLRV